MVILSAASLLLLSYGFLLGVLVHERRYYNNKVVGGFWKTAEARQAQKESNRRLSGTDLMWGAESGPGNVWPKASRSMARQCLVACYILFIAASAGALTCGGAVVIAARTARIEEFTVDPLKIAPKQAAMLRWRARNVDSVKLQAGEGATPVEVAGSGEQPVSPQASLAYNLEAKNAFRAHSVQRALVVTAQNGPVAPKPRHGAGAARSGAAQLEARLCRLSANVVIRGSGWLESDGAGTSDAECILSVPAGRYQIFVEYASDLSRPVRVLLNQSLIAENGLAAVTGGRDDMNLLNQTLGVYAMRQGANSIQFHTEHGFPMIRRIRFEPV